MKNKDNRWPPYLLIGPAFLVILIFVIYPMFSAFVRSFSIKGGGGFTLEHYTYFFTDPIQIQNILYTLYVVLITVILTFIISFLLALFLRFSKSKLAGFMGWLVLLPRFVPGMVAVYSMILMIKDAGVIIRVLDQVFGIQFSLGWMYNVQGIITMNLWFNIPFSTLIILSALSNVKDSYIESLRDVGGGKLHILNKLILPITYKTIIMSMTFVYMGNIGSFTTPFLMGANHPKMLGVGLYDQFNSYMDYERAAALSVIIFLLSSFAAVVYIMSNLKEAEWERS
ncbi:ABC transporter permease [Eremococcus coleocola]|uniref:ABC transporter permease n=1 Tax=Eremococcus coleocola TaxID=88132 RepID=UPI0004180949|nr:ABC transporter permease subunit [Eremococcus coleocola]